MVITVVDIIQAAALLVSRNSDTFFEGSGRHGDLA